jgi:hypothetical protein
VNTRVEVGQVWKRRVELHDPYDVVKVVGMIDNAGERQNEWTVAPRDDFGAVIGTTAAGILDHCDLVEAAPGADTEWVSDV